MSKPRTVTSREEFKRLAAGLDAPARIPVELRTEIDNSYDAYRRARDPEVSVYLETTGRQDGWGYFAPDPER